MYNYAKLILDILTGREIEFSYNNKQWFIGCGNNGKCISCDGIRVSEYYSTDEEFARCIETFLLDGKGLKEIFDTLLYDKKSLIIF